LCASPQTQQEGPLWRAPPWAPSSALLPRFVPRGRHPRQTAKGRPAQRSRSRRAAELLLQQVIPGKTTGPIRVSSHPTAPRAASLPAPASRHRDRGRQAFPADPRRVDCRVRSSRRDPSRGVLVEPFRRSIRRSSAAHNASIPLRRAGAFPPLVSEPFASILRVVAVAREKERMPARRRQHFGGESPQAPWQPFTTLPQATTAHGRRARW
jgi:hypothetical protein